MPLISVIIATRDRPQLFFAALDSVVTQEFADFEVIVVNDGSSPVHQSAYDKLLDSLPAALQDKITYHQLVRRANGHGQSYALNYGVDHSEGEYVTFLDDDDSWVDKGHLNRIANCLSEYEHLKDAPIDLYMANQHAYREGVQITSTVWIEDLAEKLAREGLPQSNEGAYYPTLGLLLSAHGFCHLNCLTVRKLAYLEVGGMDEGIRWECDRDIFLRLIDQCEHFVYHPAVVSRHNVPVPAAGTSMTTSLSETHRRLYQITVLQKAALMLETPLIREHAKLAWMYSLKKLSEKLAQEHEFRTAAVYARQALAIKMSLKWIIFTTYLSLRGIFSARDVSRG